MVARKMPMAVVANRHSAAPAMNSGMLPSIGTCSRPRTTRFSEMPAASSTTAPIDQTLASMISRGRDGHDQQVLDGAVLALADQRRAGEDDGQHGHVVDDLHQRRRTRSCSAPG